MGRCILVGATVAALGGFILGDVLHIRGAVIFAVVFAILAMLWTAALMDRRTDG